jgi:molecular chaperone DnaK
MVKEAEAHAAEDAQRRQEIELRNQTDSLVYQVQRGLAEHGAKLSEDERREVEQAMTGAREALQGEDIERIRRAQESLQRVSATLAQAMSGEPTAGAGAQTSGGPREGEVVDAEFEDVDERKAS